MILSRTMLTPGYYTVTRYAPEKGVGHVGVLVVGNGRDIPFGETRVLERVPEGLRFDLFDDRAGWCGFERMADQGGAAQRTYEELMSDPKYDLLFNNCEHTASKVVTGQRESPQVWKALLLSVGVVAGIVLVSTLIRKGSGFGTA